MSFLRQSLKAVGSELLISSSHCGYQDFKPGFSPAASKQYNDTSAAILYARACYNDAPNELQCNRFPRSRLASTSEANVSCPFQSDICFEGPSAAFQVKSGWIDTNTDLGINSKASDRLQYRKVTTCSVLHTAGHVDIINMTNSAGDSPTIANYYYGPVLAQNYTFAYNLDSAWSSRGYVLT